MSWGTLQLLTSTSVLPCTAARAAEAPEFHSQIWHTSPQRALKLKTEAVHRGTRKSVCMHRPWTAVSCNHSWFGSETSDFIPEDMVLDTEFKKLWLFFQPLDCRKHMSNRFFVLMDQLWKYLRICKTVTSSTSYPSAKTKLPVFLLSPHILSSPFCFIFTSAHR